MARCRLLVALVPPPELTAQLRAVRALVGGPSVERIVAHVTLVPPFNVQIDRLDEVRRAVRTAVADLDPFAVELGPAASFAPTNPTLHLRVGGEELDRLRELRELVRVGPMDRPDRHEFVPHLTLRRGSDPAVTSAAPQVLQGRLGPWEVDRVHLMVQVHDERGTAWELLAEEPFGGPVVVGRGGVELHLRTIRTVEALWRAGEGDEVPQQRFLAVGGDPLVVAGELPEGPGRVVGLAVGATEARTARLVDLVVAEPHRGLGIARHLLGWWCTGAAQRGATVALAEPRTSAATAALEALGWTIVGDLAVRRLRPPPG